MADGDPTVPTIICTEGSESTVIFNGLKVQNHERERVAPLTECAICPSIAGCEEYQRVIAIHGERST